MAKESDIRPPDNASKRDAKTPTEGIAAAVGQVPSCVELPISPTRSEYRLARPVRVLIGKVGLDGHDRGAKYVAHILRDAGYEVIYTGIRRTPEQIVATAIQEDVAIIGLSFLSGAQKCLLKRVIDLLNENDARDIIIVGGGIIPTSEVSALQEMGVEAVFTPGASAKSIVETLETLLKRRRGGE